MNQNRAAVIKNKSRRSHLQPFCRSRKVLRGRICGLLVFASFGNDCIIPRGNVSKIRICVGGMQFFHQRTIFSNDDKVVFLETIT